MAARKDDSHPETVTVARTAATRWKIEGGRAKCSHGEFSLQGTNKNNIWRTLNALKGPVETGEVGNVQGETSFQGKCDYPRKALFPATGTTPPLPPSQIPTPLKNIINQFMTITAAEIIRCLANTCLSSAPGRDNIRWTMVAAIHNPIPLRLSEIYPALLRHGITPPKWKTAKCILIPKPGKKEKDEAKSFRLISLLSCLSKTLETVVAQRIVEAAIEVGAINNNQTNSRARRSVQDALLRLLTHSHDWLWSPKSTGKALPIRPTLVANDINGAFNTVRHDRLIDVMRMSGFPSYLTT